MDQQRSDDSAGDEARAIATPSDVDVRDQLARILSSSEFSVPDRIRQFLLYIVNETLAGRSERIKAYSVAVEVFGRDANLDIQNDPVVRIEAGRLRRALERYYFLGGMSDPILIEIPKGGYVPRFHLRDNCSARAELPPQSEPFRERSFGQLVDAWLQHSWLIASVAATAMIAVVLLVRVEAPSPPAASAAATVRTEGPSLIVKPFANLSKTPEGEYYVAGLGEELLTQLARFKELSVFGPETSNSLAPGTSAAGLAQRFGTRYILEGGVRLSEGKLRVTSRIRDGETSAILWSETYDADPRSEDVVDMQIAIASKVATALWHHLQRPPSGDTRKGGPWR